MRSLLCDGTAKQLTVRIALVAGLLALLVTLAPTLDAQTPPPAPHWFWGRDAESYTGAQIQIIGEDGNIIASASEESGVVDSAGGWHVSVFASQSARVKLRLVTATVSRETDYMDVISGGFDPSGLSITAFRNTVTAEVAVPTETITVRIIARRAADGRIEFGMRGPDGENILPPARFFPAAGPGHSRWLRSTEIDFGSGFTGRIIARHVAVDGRTEFGFRVEGYDDIFPRARFFPAEGPDHNRFLRSSEIEIGMPR